MTVAASGGTVTTSGNYRIHTFTSTSGGTFVVNTSMSVNYLVVAGGGPGGKYKNNAYGGGGAGGFRTGTLAVSVTSYPIVVGNGGLTSTPSNGGNSTFSSITSIGGGTGGYYNTNLSLVSPTIGGSGGGGPAHADTNGDGYGAAGTVGQGNAGGQSYPPTTASYGGGGGGGAGSVGSSSHGTNGREGGYGGTGTASSISGSSVTYDGGGGGSHNSATAGASQGGAGGGGNGGYGNSSSTATAGTNGVTNTGGGGGGACYYKPGGDGGSGIVIISYLMSNDIIPANIGALSMTCSSKRNTLQNRNMHNRCKCNMENTGGAGTSDLFITVSNGSSTITPPSYSSVSFTANQEIMRTFTVSNMAVGSHSICPNPN